MEHPEGAALLESMDGDDDSFFQGALEAQPAQPQSRPESIHVDVSDDEPGDEAYFDEALEAEVGDLFGVADAEDASASAFDSVYFDEVSETESQGMHVESDFAARVKGRKRGRLFGNNHLREVLRMQKAAEENVGAQPEAELTPTEKAREAKSKKARSSKESIAANPPANAEVLAKFGDPGVMHLIGSNVQKSCFQALKMVTAKPIAALEEEADPLIEEQLNGPLTHLSYAALADKVGETNAKRRSISIAASILEWSCWMWGSLFSVLAEVFQGNGPKYIPIAVVLKMRYDETPMRVAVVNPREPSDPAYLQLLGGRRSFNSADKSSSLQAKVLQSELSFATLVKEAASGKLHLMHGRCPTCLQCLDKCTGENMCQALLFTINSVPEFRRVSAAFPIKLRLSCTDRHPSNYKAERLLDSHFPELTRCHVPCDVHKLYTSTTAAMKPSAADVSGLLSVALSMSDPGALGALHDILKKIFMESLSLQFGSPPAEAEPYRNQLFDTFLPITSVTAPRRRSNLKRRYIIAYFLNGHLQQDEITHHCLWQCCPTPESTLGSMCWFLSWALLPFKAPKFPRSRWVRYEESIDWCGLLAGTHNLLERIFTIYCGKAGDHNPKGSKASQLHKPDAFPVTDRDAWDAEYEAELASESKSTSAPANAKGKKMHRPGQGPRPAAEFIDDEDEDAEPIQDEKEPGVAKATAKTALTFQEINEQNKVKAGQWVKSNPFPRLVILRAVATWLLGLMTYFLMLGGQPWDKKQQADAANGQKRKYAVMEAATGLELQTCMAGLGRMLHSPPPLLTPDQWTPELRTKLFCSISAAMTALHVLLRVPRRGCPYQLFKLLQRTQSAAEEILNIPDCMLDGLTETLRSRYCTAEDLLGDECQGVLESLASIFSLDTVEIEAKHGSNRELTMLRGRGWVPSLLNVAASALSRFVSRRARDRAAGHGSAEKKAASKSRRTRPKRGGGGAWRAFCHERSKGQKFTLEMLRQLAAEYARLGVEEKQIYVEAGMKATLAHKHGHSSFASSSIQPSSGKANSHVGDLTSDGATIAPDPSVASLSILEHAGETFMDRYAQVRQSIVQGKTLDPCHVDEEGVLALARVKESASNNAIVKGFHQSKHTEVSGAFDGTPTNSASLISLEWFAPVTQAVKARRRPKSGWVMS